MATERQPEAEPATTWGHIQAYIREREGRCRPVDRLTAGLERILATEQEQLGYEQPARVVERMDIGYSVLQAQAAGDRPDNDLLQDRYQAGGGRGALPTARSGRSDPTATQAARRIDLQRIDAKLRAFASRHRIPLPDQPLPREDVGDDIAALAEQFIERGWNLQQIDDEMRHVGILAADMRLCAGRVQAQLRRLCKVCMSPLRAEIDTALAGGSTVREIEEWLRDEGLEISDSTISRHRVHVEVRG